MHLSSMAGAHATAGITLVLWLSYSPTMITTSKPGVP